jgi:glycogen synthase
MDMREMLLVSYETRYARCGGITAVMNYLPGYLRRATGLKTSIVTPFHYRIPETRSLPVRPVADFTVPFFGDTVNVMISRYDDRWPWLFLDASGYLLPEDRRTSDADERFFGGRKHPYDVGSHAAEQGMILRRDSLFFGAAVARALRELGSAAEWTLILQDWQAASAALALTGPNRPGGLQLFLTLHNSYDSGPVMSEELLAFGMNPDNAPAPPNRATMLGRAIPLLDKPLFTVSEQFALDLTEDVFQKHIMADHLQDEFAPPRLIGVNNGPFTSLSVPEETVPSDASRMNYAALRAWKSGQKAACIAALERFVPDEEKRPVWGRITRFVEMTRDQADSPWFVLAGRDDTRQKGYDVAAEAIRAFLQKPGNAARAQFLFFPIPGDEGREGLTFLHALAADYPANILVMPFIFQEGYRAALQGAAFGVMPSFYEPFGMANEFYLNGAVGIGRATGGLLQQIVPLRSVPSFTSSVERRSTRWHPISAAATGLLYREPDDITGIVGDWRAFNAAGYLSRPDQDRVTERRAYRLFTEMVRSLEHALADAIDIYDRVDASGVSPYFAMLTAGIAHIQKTFSWERAAAKYNRFLTRLKIIA